jgi:hypothetical protein
MSLIELRGSLPSPLLSKEGKSFISNYTQGFDTFFDSDRINVDRVKFYFSGSILNVVIWVYAAQYMTHSRNHFPGEQDSPPSHFQDKTLFERILLRKAFENAIFNLQNFENISDLNLVTPSFLDINFLSANDEPPCGGVTHDREFQDAWLNIGRNCEDSSQLFLEIMQNGLRNYYAGRWRFAAHDFCVAFEAHVNYLLSIKCPEKSFSALGDKLSENNLRVYFSYKIHPEKNPWKCEDLQCTNCQYLQFIKEARNTLLHGKDEEFMNLLGKKYYFGDRKFCLVLLDAICKVCLFVR